jgi:FkbM family methyltransferase
MSSEMRVLFSLFCILITNLCFCDQQPHEFEGVSEIYNIRNLRVLAKFLPQNPVIVEIGAYQGRDTVKIAQRFNMGTVYAFEPLRTAFPKLCEAVAPFKNVICLNQALDNTSGVKDFYLCHGTYGQSPIFEFHSSLLPPTKEMEIHLLGPIEKVSCISLLDFCAKEKIQNIDLLWLSAEGSEEQILVGAHHLLSNISLVYIHTQLFQARLSMILFQDLKKFMEKNGFVLLSHFFLSNIHGDALFVKKDLF